MAAGRWKWLSLAALVVQNSAFLTVGFVSRREPTGAAYLGSVAVLLTELLKALLSLAGVAIGATPCTLVTELQSHLLGDPCWTAAFAIPALAYNLHNNLWYIAIAHLDPVTIAVTTQLKIVFAAFFSFVVLGQRLSGLQCAAIVLLVSGLALLQAHQLERESGLHSSQWSPWRSETDPRTGFAAMIAVCALSGFAGAVSEKLLRDQSRASSLWVRNVQMSLFATPIAAATVVMTSGTTIRLRGPSTLFTGFNRWLVATIVLGALGGLMVSVAFKYAGNVLKSFAIGCSIALNCVLSWLLFGIVFRREAAAGILLVILASIAYNFPRPLKDGQQLTHSKSMEISADINAEQVVEAGGEWAPLVAWEEHEGQMRTRTETREYACA